MLGRDLVGSYPVSKGTRLKAQFVPTEYSWRGKSESFRAKGLLDPSPAQLVYQGLCKTVFRTVSTARGVGWELDEQELSI